MKASRGCENLKTQADGRCETRPIHAAAPSEENAEGAETSREALLNEAAARCLGSLVERSCKPKRGSRETTKRLSGGLEREDPEAGCPRG